MAPSSPVDPDRLEAGCAFLRGLGLDVVVGEHARDRAAPEGRSPASFYPAVPGGGPSPSPRCATPGGQPGSPQGGAPGERSPALPRHTASGGRSPGLAYLAGADVDRAADIQAAWCDPAIRAVLCARGGYGAARVLDHLDWARLRAVGPKLLHGSSDITALHVAFGQRLSVTTSFGPMIASLLADPMPDPDSLDHARAALFGGWRKITGSAVLVPGRARGILTGGNLSLLTSLVGTPYAPEPVAGAIAFLEDVDEEPYRVDRMITQLLQAGWFDGVAGIVLGTWVGCGDGKELTAVFRDRLAPLSVPILAAVAAGHGGRQLTIELGGVVRLDTATGELTPEGEPAPEATT